PLTTCAGPSVTVTTSTPSSSISATVCTAGAENDTVFVFSTSPDSSRGIAFALSGPDASLFTLSSPGGTAKNGQPSVTTVTFTPKANGVYHAKLTATADGKVIQTVDLTGTAAAPQVARFGLRIKGSAATTQTMILDSDPPQVLEVYLK